MGFPATLGFISTELLVDSAVDASPYVGIAVVAAAALNGIAVLRAYFMLFTGARHMSTVSLEIGPRERFAVLTLTALILGGGLYPQPGVLTRQRAAEEILNEREANLGAAGRTPKAKTVRTRRATARTIDEPALATDGLRAPLRAYPRTGGDCPSFAQSSEQNGTVPLSETVLG